MYCHLCAVQVLCLPLIGTLTNPVECDWKLFCDNAVTAVQLVRCRPEQAAHVRACQASLFNASLGMHATYSVNQC